MVKLRQAVDVEQTKAAEDLNLLGCDALSLGIYRLYKENFVRNLHGQAAKEEVSHRLS
jgi:hypothetical protein